MATTPRSEPRQHPPLARGIREDAFQEAILEVARLYGWLCHHTRAAQNRRGQWATPLQGDAGYVDLTLVHPDHGTLIFWELKRDGADLEPAQVAWRDALHQAGATHEVIRPSDWEYVVRVLSDGQAHVQ